MALNKRKIEIFSKATFGLNLITIVLGILYSVIGAQYFLVVIFSFIIIVTWISDICLVLINDINVKKDTVVGKRINLLGYSLMLFQIFSVILLVAGLFLLNADWTSNIIQYTLIYLGFYGFFVFGLILSLLNLSKLQLSEVWKFE